MTEIVNLEQKRIGQDLHDNVGQELTAVGLLVDSLLKSLRQHDPDDLRTWSKGPRRSQESDSKSPHHSRSAWCRWKSIRAGCSPRSQNWPAGSAQDSGLPCTFTCAEPVSFKSSIEATHFYYIAQEACTNAMKHSQAKNIDVRLQATLGRVVLEIQDDGIGFADQPGKPEGLGFRIMKNRSGLIGAELTIEPAKPRGTLVTCTLNKEQTRVAQAET